MDEPPWTSRRHLLKNFFNKKQKGRNKNGPCKRRQGKTT